MKTLKTTLLLLEFMAGFGPLVYLWFLGVYFEFMSLFTMSFMWMLDSVRGAFFSADSFFGFFLLLLPPLGAFGLWGIFQLLLKVMAPSLRVMEPKRIKIFLTCGCLATLAGLILFGLPGSYHLYAFLAPLLVTAHFAYLGRAYLWNPNRENRMGERADG